MKIVDCNNKEKLVKASIEKLECQKDDIEEFKRELNKTDKDFAT